MNSAMTVPRSLLVGGPLDGETISPGQQANFVWVQLSARGAPRCYSEHQTGRHLYRLFHKVRPYKYLYAGHTHAICPKCGGFTAVSDTRDLPLGAKCVLCGEAVSTES